MSDVMSVRLHLSGVRVTGVLVDSVALVGCSCDGSAGRFG